MTQALYLLLAIAIGAGSAVQTGMVASISRARGPTEAAWISILASACGLALVLALRALRGNTPSLPPPMNGVLFFGGVSLLGFVALAVALKGVNWYLGITGLFGIAYVVSAAFLAPRIGIALFASAITAGTLFGAIALDQIGSFGADPRPVSIVRLAGVMLLFAGVVVVRAGR
jgi:uncharacterized membrane protein YdcZ (DUF606 family)